MSNYIDKYLPMQVHREIYRCFSFIFENNRDLRNRIDWYDEIKTPLLTSLILCDTGKEALDDKMKAIKEIALESIDLGIKEGQEPLTQEEAFVKKAVNNK